MHISLDLRGVIVVKLPKLGKLFQQEGEEKTLKTDLIERREVFKVHLTSHYAVQHGTVNCTGAG